jgi:septal ring factor EnvC (AmiA/AmiB activator)
MIDPTGREVSGALGWVCVEHRRNAEILANALLRRDERIKELQESLRVQFEKTSVAEARIKELEAEADSCTIFVGKMEAERDALRAELEVAMAEAHNLRLTKGHMRGCLMKQLDKLRAELDEAIGLHGKCIVLLQDSMAEVAALKGKGL